MSYELAPQPSSLFHGGVMRQANKGVLGTFLKSFVPAQLNMPDNCQYVVDGGHLLQSVVWPQQSNYNDVCDGYVSYILKHYGTLTSVVFDEYSTISIKAAAQQRQAKKATSSNILFDLSMPTTTSQAAFLANGYNKERVMQMLSAIMSQSGILTKQAKANADAMIVLTALTLAESGKPVIAVGTDTDILVMLVARATTNMDVHMLCRKNPPKLYRIRDIQDNIGDTSFYLMVLHAITGCDTVSAPFRQGKRKAFNLLHKKQDYGLLKNFNSAGSTHQEVQKAGESFLLKIYGASNKCTSLDKLRYIAYKKSIRRASLSSTFQLSTLPLTSAAAKQHSFRTYLTVQEWMGHLIEPTDWGWRLDESNLTPIETDQPIAPDTLLNMISCSCKADVCSVSCSCRRLGVHCSNLCTKCNGYTCNNVTPVASLLDVDQGEIEEPSPVSPDSNAEDDDYV